MKLLLILFEKHYRYRLEFLQAVDVLKKLEVSFSLNS